MVKKRTISSEAFRVRNLEHSRAESLTRVNTVHGFHQALEF